MSTEFENNDTDHPEEQVYITKTFVRADGYIYKETTLNGMFHASPTGEPSFASIDPSGTPIHHAWHAFGEYHRIDGPAIVAFHGGTKQPKTETFLINARPRPRQNGPYRIRWNVDGTLWKEEFAESNTYLASPKPDI